MTKKIEPNKNGPNDRILDGMTKLMRKYELEKNKGKAITYRKAINSLKSVIEPITQIEQVKKLPGIGKSICAKIEDFLETDEFMEVAAPFDEEKMKAIEELTKVWSIGDSKAIDLFDKGYKSVRDLRTKPGGLAELYSLQKIGLKYYEDLDQKIPRLEVTQIQKLINKTVKELFKEKMLVQAVGSYRRGREMCGDADILVTRLPNQSFKKVRDVSGILQKIVGHLQGTGFILERLGANMISKTGSETFMGICRLQGKNQRARRIDLKVYPSSQFGFALMYFTGCAEMNKQMRNVALLNGYTMSDSGIKKLPPKKDSSYQTTLAEGLADLTARSNAEEIVSEREIYKAFGIDYIQPCDREPDRLNFD